MPEPTLSYRRYVAEPEPLPIEAAILFTLADGNVIELRHKGTYVEAHAVYGGFGRLIVMPAVSNEVHLAMIDERQLRAPREK